MKKCMTALSIIILFLSSSLLISGADLEGTWNAKLKDDTIQMRMRIRPDEDFKGEWSYCDYFKKSDFTNLVWGKSEAFSLVREAGTVEFEAEFADNSASGHFTFIPNGEFASFLEKKGFEGVTDKKMLSLFMTDVNRQYVNDLFELGYSDITLSKLISFAIHDVSIELVKSLHDLGYGDIEPSTIISFAIHDVTIEYIKDIHSLGYKDISPSELISFRIHDVDKEFIKHVQEKWDKKPTPSKIISLKIHDF